MGTLAFISEYGLQRSGILVASLQGTRVLMWFQYSWSRKDIFTCRQCRDGSLLIPAVKGLIYEERFCRLGPCSLEFRRVRVDLIETDKILRRISRVNAEWMFSIVVVSRAGESASE